MRRSVPDVTSSSSGIDMARRLQRAPSRNGDGGQGASELGVTMAAADEYPLHGSDSEAD